MTPIERAHLSLSGLCVGDALGERLSHAGVTAESLDQRELPDSPWGFTDDTEMAITVFETLEALGQIDGQRLMAAFVKRFDEHRGYSSGTSEFFMAVKNGGDAKTLALARHNQQGSYGSGAAVRVAPVGAYFAEDLDRVVVEAQCSARVTHTHCEAVAGAVAIAVGTALAAKVGAGRDISSIDFLKHVLLRTPESLTRKGIQEVFNIDSQACPVQVAEKVGAGEKTSAQDTVPFALWCAARDLGHYENALWTAARGRGDSDTICAMVGGMVIMSDPGSGIPQEWLKRAEALPRLG